MLIDLLFRDPFAFLLFSLLLLSALSFHEFSHALMADRLGDPTARLAGRLTLNPLAHLDPWGTLLLLFAGFGWGKPVPYDPFNLRNPKKDSALISFAGPFSNLLLAIFASVILNFFVIRIPLLSISSFIGELLKFFIYYNIILAVFNLLPIHPLDGFQVVAGLLPKKYYEDWLSLAPYGMIFLALLIIPFFGSSPIAHIISPVVNIITSVLIPTNVGGII